MRKCWCNSASFSPFNQDYLICNSCKTLVLQNQLNDEVFLVKNDETDFYGKQYWLNHQSKDLGNTDIYTRSRMDLSERNLHWLKNLLKYKLPPAKILEVGCSHGSFVALMKQTGYDALGVELSPWVVDLGKNTFDIAVHTGPLESLQLTEEFDLIVLMDVLEHLPNPVETMTHCTKLLKSDGILLIQTPQFKEEMQYQELVKMNDVFLNLLIDEHIYLFTKDSVTQFFKQLNLPYIQFEVPIFSHYDMFFAVSANAFKMNSIEQIESTLLSSAKSRLVLALLDVRERELQLIKRLHETEADCAARLEQINSISSSLEVADFDRTERSKQIETLASLIHESEATIQEQQEAIQEQQEAIQEQQEAIHESNEAIQEQNRVIETQKFNLDTLFSRRLFRLANRLARWPEIEKLRSVFDPAALKTIAVDLTPILPGGENGGAKIFVLELIKRLAKLAPQTKFVLLTQAASHEELQALECPNIKCMMVLNQPVKNSKYYRWFSASLGKIPYVSRKLSYLGCRVSVLLKRKGALSLLHNIKADLLFCPFTAPTYFELGVPTVCTIYDLQYKTYPEFFTAEDVVHREHTFNEACRRASMLTAISEYSRQSAITHGGIKPEKIRTIYLQMAHRILPKAAQDTSVLARLKLEPKQYLLYPANFWQHKNHKMLLTAFGMACKEGLEPSVKLICTGSRNTHLPLLIEAAKEMNLGERILFPGYLENNELATLIANSSGVIFPSLYEGFGLPVIEAMAAGVPVACSNLTSLPEIVGNAAILFNPRIPTEIAEAIISLQHDNRLREQLISAGTERAKLFSDSSRMAQEYWYLFQHALKESHLEDALIGTYEDGWVGSRMNIQIGASSTGKQELEMELFAPDWLPQSKVVVQTLRGGKVQNTGLEVARGKTALLTLPISAEGAQFEIRMSPTFVPAKTGYSNSDQRELSLIVQRCSVVRDGKLIHLVVEKKQA